MTIGFSKSERKISNNSIKAILDKGEKLYSPSFKLIWTNRNYNNAIKIKLVTSVSKKKFKKAVDRNYIKRIIRESYLLCKPIIYKMINPPVNIILIYTHDNLPALDSLKTELLTLLKLLSRKIHENPK
tara:strand:- start:1927 stop:2310 length:384 start_codon:yes stop_codon:yes gene_type:complete